MNPQINLKATQITLAIILMMNPQIFQKALVIQKNNKKHKFILKMFRDINKLIKNQNNKIVIPLNNKMTYQPFSCDLCLYDHKSHQHRSLSSFDRSFESFISGIDIQCASEGCSKRTKPVRP